ncbi:hypothetical protein BX600DRAFT_430759 [Xylariales sp. PMI_506]|nr:hypothetical protein BX600DRAFT_430759 [Xylariales sp. PMI_506]
MASSSVFHRNPASHSQISLGASTLPPYSEFPEGMELANLTPSSSSSRSDADEELAATEGGILDSKKAVGPSRLAGAATTTTTTAAAAVAFVPTAQLQIQTEGKALISLPLSTPKSPIPVFTLSPDASGRDTLDRPLYLSVRPSRGSGSCYLSHGDDETGDPTAALATTTYRFGPGRPPVIKLSPSPADSHSGGSSSSAEGREEEVEIHSSKIFSRAQRFDTSLGAFEWRYARSEERAAAGADSLLVMELVLDGSGGGSGSSSNKKKQDKQQQGEEQRVRVAQLVRSEAYRTPGTSRSTAGNGGRLMLDLRYFDEKARDRAQVLAVTTVLVMLKKEVDRRRVQQMATISAVVGGAS